MYWLVMLYIVFMVNIYDSVVIFLKQKGTDFGHFYYHTNFRVFLSFCFFVCCCSLLWCGYDFSVFFHLLHLHHFVIVPFCNTKKLPNF